MKSTTCKGSNGQYLEEYHSQTAAEMGAEYLANRNAQDGNVHAGRDMPIQFHPIHCNRCGYWHLTPVNTRRQCMFCTDSALFLKDIYNTKEEAQRTADHLRKEKKVQLTPYKCPHGSGWHLTKK